MLTFYSLLPHSRRLQAVAGWWRLVERETMAEKAQQIVDRLKAERDYFLYVMVITEDGSSVLAHSEPAPNQADVEYDCPPLSDL